MIKEKLLYIYMVYLGPSNFNFSYQTNLRTVQFSCHISRLVWMKFKIRDLKYSPSTIKPGFKHMGPSRIGVIFWGEGSQSKDDSILSKKDDGLLYKGGGEGNKKVTKGDWGGGVWLIL